VSTGFGPSVGWTPGQGFRFPGEQRIDAFALHTWPSKKYRRVAYEVKASRSDLKRELDQWQKSQAALALSNEFYLICPNDILLGGITDYVPEAWGIQTFDEGQFRTLRKAPWREAPFPPYSFMLSLARNLQAETERSRS
jgi:hypothetical protein